MEVRDALLRKAGRVCHSIRSRHGGRGKESSQREGKEGGWGWSQVVGECKSVRGRIPAASNCWGRDVLESQTLFKLVRTSKVWFKS